MISANLAEQVLQNCRRRGDRIALRDAHGAVTYGDLGAAITGYAGFLQARGVGRGQVVGLTMADGVQQVVALLALVGLGAILLPMDPRWTPAETESVAAAFDAAFVLTDSRAPGQAGATECLLHDPEAAAAGHAFAPPADFSPDEPLLISLSSGTTGVR